MNSNGVAIIPNKIELAKYYEKEYLSLHPSLHLEKSKPVACEIISSLGKFMKSKLHTMADLGCGAGLISKELEAITERSIGSDISSTILRIAKRVNPNLLLIRSDCENPPFRRKSIDLVLLVDVLEHLRSPERAIAEASLMSSRWLIIRVPLEDCLYRRFKKYEWKAHFGHIFEFNLNFLIGILKKNGVKVLEVHPSKLPFSAIEGKLLTKVGLYILPRILPSPIYRLLFPGEFLILGETKPSQECISF